MKRVSRGSCSTCVYFSPREYDADHQFKHSDGVCTVDPPERVIVMLSHRQFDDFDAYPEVGKRETCDQWIRYDKL